MKLPIILLYSQKRDSSLFHHYSVHLCNSVSTQICIYAAEYYKLFSYNKINSHQWVYLPFSEQKPYFALIYKYIRTKHIR